ncbi:MULTISPECIES: GNAT family N-acetyltransferase [unclassified Francisella]|uniref:GNAT family N-acetyltransferase n=1 Tax=unclassified Francisella TaxID=2610885 RepID=UPI002E32A2D7|nr:MULTISPECIES: GNAT family N-acetyltransferase [unclassified Francisella]MED7818460.1 GNAT family N-acetyltransferase [Francisella sp. 19S2-4]MED7829285.1 GNAT family N-acetyltransferase [Francisella sp. 19S2-10]
MSIKFCNAEKKHLKAIVALLRDDFLGKNRQDLDFASYEKAFQDISNDENNQIIIGLSDDLVISCAQITYIPGLTYSGQPRLQVEGVRVHKDYSGKGIGSLLFKYIEKIAVNKNCVLIQLTTDKLRDKAINFYEKLGFVSSHIGMKKKL